MRWNVTLLAASLFLGCTAVQKQTAKPPVADDLHFHNLQVLPANISREELGETMRRFAQAMGKDCGFCHAANPAGTNPRFDFVSDAKPQKESARTMILMTRDINMRFIPKIPEALTTVSCWTCHRGSPQPDLVPSLPAETR